MSEPTQPLLSVRDLRTSFFQDEGTTKAVDGASFEVNPGRTLGIVGESGCGKSVTAQSILRLVIPPGRITDGEILLTRKNGSQVDITKLEANGREMREIRGGDIGLVFQEPMTSFSPVHTIGAQLIEAIRLHNDVSAKEARRMAIEVLRSVGVPKPERRIDEYSFELSGGLRQRAMIAVALSCDPRLLIADEPTTALDVTVQAQILDLLRDLQKRLNMALLLITHDLGLVRRYASRVYVMRAGEIVESGDVAAVMANPQSDYTRALIDAEPAGAKAPPPLDAPKLLDARDIRVTFALSSGVFSRSRALHAVDGVSLALREGQTLGIVGESGSGKSTLGRALLRLTPCAGALNVQGIDIQRLDQRAMRPLRRQMQLVFQDPFGSLSPRMNIGDIVSEGLLVHAPQFSARQRDAEAARALAEVGLDPEKRWRTPNEFSGGQRQRIAIARAMILKPKLLVLDEPTSALDRSVQKEVLALLRMLQNAHQLSYVFISHDLAVIRAMADEILVMKDGRVVERGATPEIFERPQQEYTQRLIAAAMLARRDGA